MKNGQLDTRTLTLVDGWAFLAAITAVAWNAACDEMVALGYERPRITSPDGAYRTFERQSFWKRFWVVFKKPFNAATPGFSNHGWGTAVDIANVHRFPRAVLREVFARHGFTFNVPTEDWHAQHNGLAPAAADVIPIIERTLIDMPLLLLKQDATPVTFALVQDGVWNEFTERQLGEDLAAAYTLGGKAVPLPAYAWSAWKARYRTESA